MEADTHGESDGNLSTFSRREASEKKKGAMLAWPVSLRRSLHEYVSLPQVGAAQVWKSSSAMVCSGDSRPLVFRRMCGVNLPDGVCDEECLFLLQRLDVVAGGEERTDAECELLLRRLCVLECLDQPVRHLLLKDGALL